MKLDNKRKIVLSSILAIVIIIILVVYLNFFRTFTVTFTLKIGAGIETQEVKVGSKVLEPKRPEAEGYNFIGWYLNGEEYDFNSPVKSDLNLEAKWEKAE